MKLSINALALAVLILDPALAIAAPSAQPLAIDIHADGARATQLPAYDPGIPIAVSVTGSGGGTVDAVTVIAAGPAGESVQAPLTRMSDGSFGATLSLQDLGSWRLRLTSRAGSISTNIAPVMLDVQAPPPANAWQIGLAVGAGIFLIVGGTGFFALRRIAGQETRAGARAA